MRFRPPTLVSRIGLLTFAAALSCVTVPGQVATPPAAPVSKPAEVSPAIPFEVYAGYSYFRPFHSSIDTTFPDGTVVPANYGSSHTGSIASISYFFSKYAGVQIEAGQNPDGSNDGFWTGQGGVVIHKPSHTFQPFAHLLGGATEVAGANGVKDVYYHVWTWRPSVLIGGGVDYELPYFSHRFSYRIVQADYTFFNVDFGSQTNGTGGSASINAIQLSSGIVWHPGTAQAPVTYACTASPATVYPGDPVTLTGTAVGLNPRKKAVYTWSGQGVTIKGDSATGTIDTSNLAPGAYPVTGRVSEGKKPGMFAECSASATVKPFDPPTVACSSSPDTVAPGGTSTITATGASPQNRPLTYSFSSSAGDISATGNTATLSTTGAPAGSITVTCNTTDDKNQTASSTATVTVPQPAAPGPTHVQNLCSITFGRDATRPARVDNEAKACLDSVTLGAKSQPDAAIVVVGESTADERGPSKAHVAAQRAANTRAYLSTEEGLDPARILIRTGSGDTPTVENYLVPAGVTFESEIKGTVAVDPSSVGIESRKIVKVAKHRGSHPAAHLARHPATHQAAHQARHPVARHPKRQIRHQSTQQHRKAQHHGKGSSRHHAKRKPR